MFYGVIHILCERKQLTVNRLLLFIGNPSFQWKKPPASAESRVCASGKCHSTALESLQPTFLLYGHQTQKLAWVMVTYPRHYQPQCLGVKLDKSVGWKKMKMRTVWESESRKMHRNTSEWEIIGQKSERGRECDVSAAFWESYRSLAGMAPFDLVTSVW
jgi:hypothetical protein